MFLFSAVLCCIFFLMKLSLVIVSCSLFRVASCQLPRIDCLLIVSCWLSHLHCLVFIISSHAELSPTDLVQHDEERKRYQPDINRCA